jgi:hypothetical protein
VGLRLSLDMSAFQVFLKHRTMSCVRVCRPFRPIFENIFTTFSIGLLGAIDFILRPERPTYISTGLQACAGNSINP